MERVYNTRHKEMITSDFVSRSCQHPLWVDLPFRWHLSPGKPLSRQAKIHMDVAKNYYVFMLAINSYSFSTLLPIFYKTFIKIFVTTVLWVPQSLNRSCQVYWTVVNSQSQQPASETLLLKPLAWSGPRAPCRVLPICSPSETEMWGKG